MVVPMFRLPLISYNYTPVICNQKYQEFSLQISIYLDIESYIIRIFYTFYRNNNRTIGNITKCLDTSPHIKRSPDCFINYNLI